MDARGERFWVVCVIGALLSAGLTGCLRHRNDDRIDKNATAAARQQDEAPVAAPAVTTSEDEATEEEPEWADNSYCYVCHLNYDGEELTQNHEIAGVGCETCHGVSEQHSADEDGITPPEKMFAKDKIRPFCTTCHAKADIDYVDEHKPLFDQASGDKHVCTDCHGNHSMAVRTRIWDKETGRLISDDGVRMMYEDSPTTANR